MAYIMMFLISLAALAGCSSHKNPASFVQPNEPAGKLVISKEKAGGTCEKCAGLKLIRNTAMADATPEVPTGVEGATNVRLASIILVATGESEGFRVSTIPIQSDIVVKGIFSQYFRNLRIVNGSSGVQLGETIGTLSGEGPFEFHLSRELAVGSTGVPIDVYADIASSADIESLRPWIAVVTDPDGVVSFLPIQATGERTGQVVTANSLKGLQRAYIVARGRLNISPVASSSQVPAKIVTAGAEEVELFSFEAEIAYEAGGISRFIITDTIISAAYGASQANGAPAASLYNFKLYEGETQVGPLRNLMMTKIEAGKTWEGYLDFTLGSTYPYPMPNAVKRKFTLKAKVNDWPSVSSGCTHRFSLQPDPLGDGRTKAITAIGNVSAVRLESPEVEIIGSEITVRRAYPLVECLPLPTTTLAAGSTSQATLARWRVTAVGSYLRLHQTTFEVAWTDLTPTVGLEISNFKLYRNGLLMGRPEYIVYHQKVPGDTRIRAPIVFTPEEDFNKDNSSIYELKADIANAHVGSSTDTDSIVITLLGDESEGHPVTGNMTVDDQGVIGIDSHFYNFVWSDYGGDTPYANSYSQPDWTNGYQVPTAANWRNFLPLDSWRLSK